MGRKTVVGLRGDTNAGSLDMESLNSLDFFLIPRKLLFVQAYLSLALTCLNRHQAVNALLEGQEGRGSVCPVFPKRSLKMGKICPEDNF